MLQNIEETVKKFFCRTGDTLALIEEKDFDSKESSYKY